MLHFGHCPRCGTEINHEHMIGSSIICRCGWTATSKKSFQRKWKQVDRTITSMIVATGILAAAFIHVINWDTHSLAIVPLKMKEWTNTASTQELDRVGEICLERKKYDCTQSAWMSFARLKPNDTNNLARLGKLLNQQGLHKEAVAVFSDYVAAKGNQVESLYLYGQSLTTLKKYDEADPIFAQALKQKPDMFQITVTRGYIKMLMDAKRFKDAKNAIMRYRKVGATASLFMDKELTQIRQAIGEIRTTASIK